MYLASVNPATGKLLQLKMTPFQIRRFRLNRLSGDDALWVRDVLNREGHEFGTRVQLHDDDSLTLHWA
jgi:poly-gamma-glutamate capsule biosynthesis protein CapA/YwtB (metallophosphatase superfamily)